MTSAFPLELITGPRWISTHGLCFNGHPELAVPLDHGDDPNEARSVLHSLASHVLITRTRLEAGDAFLVDDRPVRLTAGADGFLLVARPAPEPRGRGPEPPAPPVTADRR